MPTTKPLRDGRRGGALLAVLWLSAALTAVAFSVATTVRGETERASTNSEGTRAYYLAAGGIHRAILYMYWGLSGGYRDAAGANRYYSPPMPRLSFNFPGGAVTVEIIPESGKLNVNTARVEEIARLLESLGVGPVQSQQIAAGIVDWRSAAEAASGPPIFSPGSTFQPRHASLEELEEILLVPGMTPDIFYGRYDHEPSGRLIPRGGLRDCLSVWGSGNRIDVNSAPAELLQAAGIPEAAVRQIIARRATAPFQKPDELVALIGDPAILGRLSFTGNSIYTLRATARVRTPNGQFSDVRKTVGAAIKILDGTKYDPPYHILRWYDEAWSPSIQDGQR